MAKETPLFVWLDGKIVPWAEATLHVASEAVVRGESVFEGVRGYGNAEHNELYIFKNQEHLDRLRQSAKLMRMTIPYDDATLTEAFKELIRRNGYRDNVYCGTEMLHMTLEQKREADQWIEEMFCFIDQDPREEEEDATLEWLIDKAADAVVRYGVEWFALDPWNQVEHKRKPHENETDYQQRAIRSLKRFARSYDCGVIVVAHPNKDVKLLNGEIRKPNLYDISGSAHWYNAADHGVIVSGDTKTNVREITVEKSRYRVAGAPGSGWVMLENGRLRATAPRANLELRTNFEMSRSIRGFWPHAATAAPHVVYVDAAAD